MNQSISQRIIAIDILRGLIIILMALDHTRDFWSLTSFSPTDPLLTTPAWFFTRWITHFCAPLFVLLTGVSAFLYGQKNQSKSKLRDYLISRGCWLIVLELIIINLSWQFAYNQIFVQVIWALGWSMIILGGLIYLPKRWILLINLPFLLLHNLIDDSFMNQLMGNQSWIWGFLHQPNDFFLFGSNFEISIVYPIIPWFSLMALGYTMGSLYLKPALVRQKALFLWGSCFILSFLVLRLSGFYGDPAPWQTTLDTMPSFLSFFNTTKYPPSLQYLLMTVGLGLMLLALLDKINSTDKLYPTIRWVEVIGGVPLFFYIIHVPVINFSAHVYTYFYYGQAVNFMNTPSTAWPTEYVPNLALTYLVWIVLIAVLYLPCKYFRKLKRNSKNPFLSYL